MSAQLALVGGGGEGGSGWCWSDPCHLPWVTGYSWSLDPLLIAVYFLPSFLVAVIGKGQLQNRHPKARQQVKKGPD